MLVCVAISIGKRVWFSDQSLLDVSEVSHTGFSQQGGNLALQQDAQGGSLEYDVVVVTKKRRSKDGSRADDVHDHTASRSTESEVPVQRTFTAAAEVQQPLIAAVSEQKPVVIAVPSSKPAAKVIAGPVSLNLAAPAVAAPSGPLLTVLELLPKYHPLFPYDQKTKEWRVSLGSPWFMGAHPYYQGRFECPVSGCVVHLHNRVGLAEADVVLYHGREEDGPDMVQRPSRPDQGVGVIVAETFQLCNRERRPESWWNNFNIEHTFRPGSFVRDTYALWFIGENEKQGMGPQTPLRTDARVWNDVWPAELPLTSRRGDYIASWCSSYCKGSRSNREDFVLALQQQLKVAIFGPEANCMVNIEEALRNTGYDKQWAEMRKIKFHFSFENHRSDGYVSEKFYWALLRGQVPVVYGAPDVARYAPGPNSYIDASEFSSAAALADYLLKLDSDDAEYQKYHAWRKERSFADYGDIFRDEILELIWIGNSTMHNVAWYNCLMCHALERDAASRVKELGSLTAPRPMGIKPMECAEPWQP